MEREIRIDILRGLALVTIVINHFSLLLQNVGMRGALIPTLTDYGYSSAAEIFVLLSGYMVGLVYMRRPNPEIALLKRGWTLYLVNLLVFLLIAPLAFLGSERLRTATGLDLMDASPIGSLFDFMTFQYAPANLDVLRLYIELMVAAPLVLLVIRRSPMAAALASVALYIAALTVLPPLPRPARFSGIGWGFDVFAWQLLFVGPMILGQYGVHRPLFAWLKGRVWVLGPVLLLLLVTGVGKRMELAGTIDTPFIGKAHLEPVRLVHSMLVLTLYAWLLANAGPLLSSWPARALALIGRNTLNCFAASLVLTYYLAALWEAVLPVHSAYLLGAAALVALVGLGARHWDRADTKREPQSAAAPVPAG